MSQRRTTLLFLFLVLGFLLLLVLVPVMNLLGGFYSAVDEVAGPPAPEEDPEPGAPPHPGVGPPESGFPAEAATESGSTGGPEEPAEREHHPGFFPTLIGRIVDVVTREPVASAKVVYAGLSGAGASWWGTSADKDGRFRIEAGEKYDPTGKWFEVRVVAPGYRTWRGNPTSADLAIEISCPASR